MRSSNNNTKFSLVVLMVVLCGSSGLASAAEITVMGYRSGGFQENYQKAVIDPFNASHPEVHVTFYGVQNAAVSLGLLRAQRANPQADAVIYDLSVAKIAKDEGLIDEIDMAKVPNAERLGSIGRELGGYALPLTYDTFTLVFNQQVFADGAPDSWKALWDPQHRGRVVVPAQGGGDIQAIALTLLTNHMLGADSDETIEPAIEALIELAPAVQTWEPKPEQYTLVANGSADISVGWNARSQYFIDQSEGLLGTVAPQEGTLTQVNVISPIAGSANPDATQTFIDYALSAEAQQRFSELMYYAPTNIDAVLDPSVEERVPFLDDTQHDKLLPVDWMKIAAARDELLNPWRRQIIPASR
ncbi:extracellular solute-binding protein [Halotalea alkalilenta]|uniref:extracellular solute-binding protein n=1 Tax=Halotalea alkalilenta TaxID=376489 RepID=UPI0009E0907E|nr:extracellular solute-binding protein [Halotalea alkalilenta]